jgi:(p)ppGpp synthase/HD superfamily hydrolase
MASQPESESPMSTPTDWIEDDYESAKRQHLWTNSALERLKTHSPDMAARLRRGDLPRLAAIFANNAHKGQKRKYNGRPYIEHPMRVAFAVSLIPEAEPEVIAAAWLHDVVEDCGILHGEIGGSFGPVTFNRSCAN